MIPLTNKLQVFPLLRGLMKDDPAERTTMEEALATLCAGQKRSREQRSPKDPGATAEKAMGEAVAADEAGPAIGDAGGSPSDRSSKPLKKAKAYHNLDIDTPPSPSDYAAP